MAELRTIEKTFDIGSLSVVSSVLSLTDEYVVIPSILSSSSKIDDYITTVIGPNGIFLLSFQLVLFSEEDEELFQDCLIHLREYAVRFQDFFFERKLKIPDPKLIVITSSEDTEFEEEPEGLNIVTVNKLKKVITSVQVESPIETEMIKKITSLVKANGIFKKLNQYQFLIELKGYENINSYMAYDTVMDKTVLIKEIKNYRDTNDIEDFEQNEVLREAKLTMQLQHENIVNVEHIIPREDSLFVVIEWVDNACSLREFMDTQSNPPEPEIAKRIISQICEALEHAHLKGIVHRNIRPENIIICQDLTVKISNFDLAKKADLETRATFELIQMVKDNPYAAPEFKLGSEGHHNIDQRVDIYSTGIIFYELLTKKTPEHFNELEWLPPSFINPELKNNDFDEIILKAIRFNPYERFTTISSLKARLLNSGKQNEENSSESRYTSRKIYKKTKNSVIYQAIDNKLSRKVALKKVLLNKLLTSEQRKQKLNNLLAEANIISKLLHPNIVSVYDYFIEDEDGYIVMEWLEGNTLREIQLEVGHFGINTVIDLGLQISEALKYAHLQNVIHKDIKPENIIYHQGKATIIDFGLAVFLENEEKKICGTMIYMSPEQLGKDGRPDQRSDIFSLGVMLYELLTGKYPYDPSIIMENFSARKNDKQITVVEFITGCPLSLNICILKAMNLSPDERYQKIDDFIEELKRINEIVSGNLAELNQPNNGFKEFVISKKKYFLILSLLAIPIILFSLKNERVKINKEKGLKEFIASPTNIRKNTIQDSADWQMTGQTKEKTTLKANLEIDQNAKKTEISLEIQNLSEDEIEILNRKDLPELVKITDEKGNDYTKDLEFTSIPAELIRIYPHSKVKGKIVLNCLPDAEAKIIFLKISEYEGKKRVFSLKIPRQF